MEYDRIESEGSSISTLEMVESVQLSPRNEPYRITESFKEPNPNRIDPNFYKQNSFTDNPLSTGMSETALKNKELRTGSKKNLDQE